MSRVEFSWYPTIAVHCGRLVSHLNRLAMWTSNIALYQVIDVKVQCNSRALKDISAERTIMSSRSWIVTVHHGKWMRKLEKLT